MLDSYTSTTDSLATSTTPSDPNVNHTPTSISLLQLLTSQTET